MIRLWREADEERRPPSIWIAEHRPVADGSQDPATPVARAWFCESGVMSERPASDYVRFLAIHEGRAWATGTEAPAARGVFNDLPGRTHSIGLAAFAPVTGTRLVHLSYAWGGTSGRGALYEAGPDIESLCCVRNLWVS